MTVTSDIEFNPRTRFVESPLFRFVSGSFVSRPSTMYPFEKAGSPLNSTLPYPFVPPTNHWRCLPDERACRRLPRVG